jgi:o-succinylbenzoate---CoA ligase
VAPGPRLPDWLGAQARSVPRRPALLAGGEEWTFAELDRRVRRAARQLASLGLRDGARAALLVRSGGPFVIAIHALTRLGAVAVPLNVRLTSDELGWQLADARPDVLLSDAATAPLAADAARNFPGLAHAVVDGQTDVGPRGEIRALAALPEADVVLREHIDLGAVQGMIYTSATSGRPKAVLLTYGNHWWSAIGSALRLGLRPDDRWLAPLGLWHVGGLAIVWRSVIYGIAISVHETFDAAAVNRDIDRGAVTLISVVSTMLERLLADRGGRPLPRSLRCVLLGGGPASPALLAACVRMGVPVAPTYGLTEAASQVATLPPEDVARKPGAAGQALLPTEIRIDASGRPADTGTIGEILVAGPTVMRGYAGRRGEAAQTLRDGWLHTGDLGYLDEEAYLYVVDRRDDLIITGGENVYPAEVEAVLCGHPAVADAGVVGLPDPVWGQAVAAVLVRRPHASPSPEDIRAFCERRLARYKMPRHLWFVDVLPRSGGGKLLRRAIREWAAAAAAREADRTASSAAEPGALPEDGLAGR